MNVPAVRASFMPWLAQSPAAPEHRIRHVNVPAVRASSMPWLAQSPAASPTTVSPSPEPLPVESVGFEASFPGASFMPWLAQIPGATATTTSPSSVLLHIRLTELAPPLFLVHLML